MGDLVTTSLSTLLVNTSLLNAQTVSSFSGLFSTISAGSIYGQFIGDGSLLTGLPAGLTSLPSNISTSLLSTNLLTAENANISSISAGQAYISSLRVDFLQIGLSTGILNMGDVVTTTLSSLIVFTGLLDALEVSTVSLATTYGFFSTISAGSIYGQFIGDGSLLTNIPNNGAVLTLSNSIDTVSNAGVTISNNLTTISNSVDTVSNKVNFLLNVSNISAFTISTTYGFFSTISAGTVNANYFIGDGSQLTNLPGGGGGGISIVPPILSTTLLSTGLLTACNISTDSISTNSGFFSTISANAVYGQFFGDGSMLTNLPTSSLSLSSGNISISTITLIDTANNSTGTIYERSSLLYFNTFVVAGAYVWTSQLIVGN